MVVRTNALIVEARLPGLVTKQQFEFKIALHLCRCKNVGTTFSRFSGRNGVAR